MRDDAAQGDLTVFTGPMFAGKTGALIDRLQGYGAARAFVPNRDDRSGAALATHDGRELSARPVGTAPEDLSALLDIVYARDPDAVGIDEAQFFPDELVTLVVELLANGYDVAVAGLDRDFRGEPFDPVPVLADMADETVEKTATCSVCGGAATRSQRLIDGEPAPEDAPQIDVGGSEKYEARCADCHELGQSR